MITYKKTKKEVQEPKEIICDVCKKHYDYSNKENIFEIQEFQHIDFVAGYGSIFRDGAHFTLDICQECLGKKLGEYLVIK